MFESAPVRSLQPLQHPSDEPGALMVPGLLKIGPEKKKIFQFHPTISTHDKNILFTRLHLICIYGTMKIVLISWW